MIDKILLAIGIIIVLPILAFLCMKLGVVGFYRGKEASQQKNEVSVNNSNDNETEN